MTQEPKLTEKQRKFVEAYMGEANGNGTEAARIAGYAGNDKTLSVVGSENLAKPCIMAAIKARQADCPLVMSRKDRQELLSKIALGKENDVNIAFGVAHEVPAKLGRRLEAINQLNKMNADYTENRNHSSPDGSMTPKSGIDFSQLPKETVEQIADLAREAIAMAKESVA